MYCQQEQDIAMQVVLTPPPIYISSPTFGWADRESSRLHVSDVYLHWRYVVHCREKINQIDQKTVSINPNHYTKQYN